MKKENNNRKLPSLVRWILWVLLIQFVLINISASFYAYRLTHFYNDHALFDPSPSRNIFAKTWRLFTGPKRPKSPVREVPGFPYQTVILKTGSGIPIETWYSKSDSASSGTVILFHGLTANKGTVLSEAYEFRFLGYNVMMVDFRAHGNSGGHTTTIAVRESEEVKLAYDLVKLRGEKKIILWGSSMGAVAVAKAVADYRLQPSGVILEMPFASLQSHLKSRARVLGFPEQPFGFLVTFWMGVERGFNGFKHQTTAYVKKIGCPLLLQWGALDSYVLKKETEKMFDAVSSSNKKLVIYDRSGHESMLQNDPQKWRFEMEGFLSVGLGK